MEQFAEIERPMKLADYCQEAEVRFQHIEAALMVFHPEAILPCQDEVAAVLKELNRWRSASVSLDEQDHKALASLRKAICRAQARADQGLNLCFGWYQLRIATSYTGNGTPQLVALESSASCEG